MAFAKLWYYALAIGSLAGTIIGVGMFALPYTALKAGFFLTLLYLAVFGFVVALTHLLYTEVTLRTNTRHRFTGYVGKYLGPTWKTVTFFQGLLSLWGTLLIYTIVAGTFLHLFLPSLLSFISEAYLGVLFFLISSIVIWRGDQTIGKLEFLFTLPMVFLIIGLFIISILSSSFSWDILFRIDAGQWIAPYGVTLFALSGFSVIPILENILEPARKKGIAINYPFVVFSGTLIPALLYILFTWGVLGASGFQTSKDALSGLLSPLGEGVVKIGALLALLAIYTSFIAAGNELQKTFYEDYRIKRLRSFIFTLAVPLGLYLFQLRDFVAITEFVGAVMGGYIGVVSVFLFWKAKKEGDATPPFSLWLPKPLGVLIIAIFIFASFYAIVDIVSSFLFSPVSN
ncbi:MAG: hypothetical protein HY001_04435 [Candidatus Portnoybacteria bacterium]|nr:hypothetical protein [Candidatus Portnoybacteria bacterium]